MCIDGATKEQYCCERLEKKTGFVGEFEGL